LRDLGIVVTSGGIALAEEADFRQGLLELRKLRKDVTTAQQKQSRGEQAVARHEADIGALRHQIFLLNQQLANLPANQGRVRNRLVAQHNARVAQLNAVLARKPAVMRAMESVRSAANQIRERYVGQALQLRQQADQIQNRYRQLANDPQVAAAIAELESISGNEYPLSPSRSHARYLHELELVEETILSEKIPLRKRGNSFLATVVLNGKHTHEMIVDSGASMISLPFAIAAQAGIEPTSQDRDIKLVMADGREVAGKMVTLDSVRVGPFQAWNVDAAVLEPSATSAEPLLGMSFLGQFKFELDAQSSTLSIVQVELPASGSARQD
jgi:aspartyl protease family protein